MPISPSDLLSTPQGYASPEQLASVQQYSDLLMKGATKDKPITSPWQGLRMMSDALSGNLMRNQAGQMGQGNRNLDASGLMNSVQPSGMPQPSAGGAQASAASPAASGVASVRNNNPGAQWPGPIASQFGATGSQTIGGGNKIASFDDPVKGAAAEFALLDKNYSGMPLVAAIGKWSGGNSSGAYAQHIAQQTGLAPNTVITPQLLRSPQGVALGRAMADWEAGGKSPLSDEQWTAAHQLAFGGQTAARSGAIGGGASPPQMGSPQAMAQALKGGSAEPPLSSIGSTTLGPEYATQRPKVNPQALQQLLSSPTLDPAMKQSLYQMYLDQYQPLDLKTTGGHIVFPYNKPGVEIPDLQKFEEEAAGAKTTTMGTIRTGQDGQLGFQGMPGASGIGGQPSPQATPPQPTSQAAAPPSPQGASAPSGATPLPQGGAGAPTPLGVMPPGAPQPSPQPAQAGDTGSRLNALANFGLGVKQRGELNTEDVKKYTENSNATIQAGTQAQQGLPMIQMAKQAVQNGNFYSGIGANAVVDFKKLKAAIGNDPNAAAANEIFEKGMAGDVLSQLRSKLQGLGQVRLAEIDLLSRATANKYNTPAANLAVLNIIERSYNQMGGLSKVADDYSSTANPPTNAGLNVALKKYLSENPTFSPDEIKNFNQTFDLDNKNVAAAAPKPGHPQPMATPAPGYSQDPPLPPGNWRKDRP